MSLISNQKNSFFFKTAFFLFFLFAVGLIGIGLISKTQAGNGDEWEKVFENGPMDARSVQQTKDGGYIVAGIFYLSGSGKSDDIFLIKTDAQGKETWRKTFGESGIDQPSTVRQTFDINKNPTGYIIAGFTHDYDNQNYNFWIIKTDENGNACQSDLTGYCYVDKNHWIQVFDSTSTDIADEVQQTKDGGYIVVGVKLDKFWLIKLDKEGRHCAFDPVGNCYDNNEKWAKTFDDASHSSSRFSVQQTKDEGYIMFGASSSQSGSDNFLIKIDSGSQEKWRKDFGFLGNKLSSYYSSSVRQTADNGYVILGTTRLNHEDSAKSADAWIIKTDENGDTCAFNDETGECYDSEKKWSKFFGAKYSKDWANSIQQTTDGGYIVANKTKSFHPDNYYDAWLTKIDSKGQYQWTKIFGINNKLSDTANWVEQTTDQGYIVAGINQNKAWLMKASASWTSNLQVSFNASKTDNVNPGDSINFTNETMGNPVNYYWDFGDVTASIERNPSHIYANIGVYTVSLAVTDQNGFADIERKNGHIKVFVPGPLSSFEANPITATTNTVIAFTNTSTGEEITYAWTFGDGDTSMQKFPIHRYEKTGSYTITLIVTDKFGVKDTLKKDNYITVSSAACSADFQKADLNSDNVIDMSDLIKITIHWAEECP